MSMGCTSTRPRPDSWLVDCPFSLWPPWRHEWGNVGATYQSAIRTLVCINMLIFSHNLGNSPIILAPSGEPCSANRRAASNNRIFHADQWKPSVRAARASCRPIKGVRVSVWISVRHSDLPTEHQERPKPCTSAPGASRPTEPGIGRTGCSGSIPRSRNAAQCVWRYHSCGSGHGGSRRLSGVLDWWCIEVWKRRGLVLWGGALPWTHPIVEFRLRYRLRDATDEKPTHHDITFFTGSRHSPWTFPRRIYIYIYIYPPRLRLLKNLFLASILSYGWV